VLAVLASDGTAKAGFAAVLCPGPGRGGKKFSKKRQILVDAVVE